MLRRTTAQPIVRVAGGSIGDLPAPGIGLHATT
jgi:hypothetical protein